MIRKINGLEELEAGCDDFVAKPFREQVVLEKMAKYLGVRYVYDRPNLVTAESSCFSPVLLTGDAGAENGTADLSFTLNAASFQVMPTQWVDELYAAADAVDNEWIFRTISSIPPVHASFASAIADLVNNFRCDRIIDLIEEFRRL